MQHPQGSWKVAAVAAHCCYVVLCMCPIQRSQWLRLRRYTQHVVHCTGMHVDVVGNANAFADFALKDLLNEGQTWAPFLSLRCASLTTKQVFVILSSHSAKACNLVLCTAHPPVTMTSVWLLPKRWMWSMASSMSATSSRVSSLAPYSCFGDEAGCRPSECAALSPPWIVTPWSRSAPCVSGAKISALLSFKKACVGLRPAAKSLEQMQNLPLSEALVLVTSLINRHWLNLGQLILSTQDWYPNRHSTGPAQWLGTMPMLHLL